MKGRWKKLLSIFLSAAMIATMAMPVSAADALVNDTQMAIETDAGITEETEVYEDLSITEEGGIEEEAVEETETEGIFAEDETEPAAKEVQMEEELETEPADLTELMVSKDGECSIANAEELLAFSKIVSMGVTTIDAKLTADIDMSGVAWTPIKDFAGVFDGQNFSILNFDFTTTATGQGLFATNLGTIKNIGDITGNFTAAKSSCGPLVGVNKGTIVNCHSSAVVTVLGNAGGIVGENAANGIMKQCSFHGSMTIPSTVTSGYLRIGGIAGSQSNATAAIIGCINRGTLRDEVASSLEYMGGIVGYMMNGKILACYNEGSLSAPEGKTNEMMGGIAYSSGGTVENCYSSAVISYAKMYGTGYNGVSNSYYLSEIADEDKGAVTAEELQSVSMVNQLNNTTAAQKELIGDDSRFQKSNGYPVLAWEGKGIDVSPVTIASVAITGSAVTGKKLKAVVTGTNDEIPTNVSYQWQQSTEDGFTDIADAVYATFTLPDNAVYAGKSLRVVVTGEGETPVISEATAPVEKSDKLKVTEDTAAITALPTNALSNITLELPETGANGCSITWVSNNAEVITDAGVVTLPQDSYASVKMTATITSNDYSTTKYYTVKVQSVDYQNVQADKTALVFDIVDFYEPQTIALPAAGTNGSTITWASNNVDCITADGVVALPESGLKYVSMTATFQINNTKDTKSFSMKVYASDNGSITQDKNALVLPTMVTEAGTLDFVATGAKGSEITWVSKNTDVISNEGVVVLPETGYVTVSVTATIKKGTESTTKSFSIRVCSLESQTKKIHVTLSLVGDDVHGNNPHTNFYKWLWEVPMEYTEADAPTAGTLISDVFELYGFKVLGSLSYITGVETPDGIQLSQMMNGSGSGWMYSVNETTPPVAIAGYRLADGDDVNLHFVHSYSEAASEPVDTPVKSVVLNKKQTALKIGETTLLQAEATPSYATNKNIIWNSSDNKVATVDATGKVTAVAEGKATITASAEADNTLFDSCEITVTRKDTATGDQTVAVTGVSLNTTKATVEIGKNTILKATVKPANATNKNVSWSSSNTSVASVNSSGRVTAKKAGTTTITVKTKDGDFTAQCKITVPAKKKAVIKLNYVSLSLQKGKTTSSVKIASSSVKNDSMKSAKSSRSSVASVVVSKGKLKITAKKAGTAVITVTSVNGASASVKITVAQKVSVKKITLNVKSKTLKKGKKLTLRATKTPVTATDKITWKSSNIEIATVNAKGVVTAKKKGTVTITAKTANGKKASCKIKVKG